MTFDFPKKGVGLPVSYLDVFISRSSWYSDQQYYVYAMFFLLYWGAQCVELKLRWQFYVHGSTCPEILLIRDIVVKSWNRQHHGQTIHPIENLIPINLFKILCVATWA